jgi:uncharacterized protein YoxC
MANLTEHVMINKWDDDINSAIVEVGGDTSRSEGLPDYPDIIKTQLISNEAVGKGIYQDFLYVDENKQTSIYPWEGESTTSTNAPQSSVIADSIKQLYNTMASMERFQVLLVDEIPKTEINLSAIYLLKDKCECGDEVENTYNGCYFIKTGKKIQRIDIPDFKVNLNELFFLTRAEYDAGLSDYVKEIEDLLRKKFGKYWNDEGFALDETIDQIVIDITNDLKIATDKILEEVNSKVEEALHGIDGALVEVDKKIESVETELNTKFDTLETSINDSLEDVNSALTDVNNALTNVNEKVDNAIEGLNTKVQQVETELNTKFDTLETSINDSLEDVNNALTDVNEKVDSAIDGLNTKVQQVETELNTKFDTLEMSINDSLEDVNNALTDVNEKVDSAIDGLNTKVQQVETELTGKFDALEEGVNNKVSELETNLLNKFDQLEDEITEDIVELRKDVEERVKISDLVSLDNEIKELK